MASTHKINGVTVEMEGEGPAVVMLHGLGGTSNTWVPQAAALSGRVRIIRPDLPGSGRSPLSAIGTDLSIDALADCVLSVMGVLNASRAHLVGHSMGTVICQRIAEIRPEAVESLALFGPIHAPPDAARKGLKDRAAKARREGMAEISDAIVAGGTSAHSKTDRPAAIAFVRESVMRQDPAGYAATCEALAGAKGADLARIDVPVLLRTGDEDAIAPPAAQQRMADAFPAADAAVFSRCGHWTTIECAAESSRALSDFLARMT